MRDDEQTARVRAWVDGYVRAWNSNDPAAIGALFTEDAAYHTEPYGEPWRGRAGRRGIDTHGTAVVLWSPFVPFESAPSLAWDDPNLKFVDLTGDGHADLLLTDAKRDRRR